MKREIINFFEMKVPSRSINEGFARMAVSAFAAQIDPTIEQLAELKTVISEAITNAVVHGYRSEPGIIYVKVSLLKERTLKIVIKDKGAGIEDIRKAMEPLYTTGNSDRAGMGFTIMQTFTDKLKVVSKPGKGTTLTMEKTL